MKKIFLINILLISILSILWVPSNACYGRILSFKETYYSYVCPKDDFFFIKGYEINNL